MFSTLLGLLHDASHMSEIVGNKEEKNNNVEKNRALSTCIRNHVGNKAQNGAAKLCWFFFSFPLFMCDLKIFFIGEEKEIKLNILRDVKMSEYSFFPLSI